MSLALAYEPRNDPSVVAPTPRRKPIASKASAAAIIERVADRHAIPVATLLCEGEREQALREGALPALTERTVDGARIDGQVIYRTRERSLGELLGDAARMTGAPREYLDQLVGHESGGNANARAPTSSALGHAQFVDQTWLHMVRTYGARYGAGDLAEAIVPGRRGSWRVADRALRERIPRHAD